MKNIVLLLAVYSLLPVSLIAQIAPPAPPPASSGQATTSEITGIGVELKIDSTKGYKTTIIKGLVAGGAAETAGLRAGDIIMNVDNKSTINVALKNVVDMIKGEEGTSAKVVVDRSGSILTYNIVRKKYTYAQNSDASSASSSATTNSYLEAEKKFQESLKSYDALINGHGNESEKKAENTSNASSYELEFGEFLNDDKSTAPAAEKKAETTNNNFELDFSKLNWNSTSSEVIKTPETVTIGSQTWMAKNLDVTTFRNGDVIPEVKTDAEWQKADADKKPAWCYYNNDPANGAKYGKLYNWWAVADARGLAPSGWHVPSISDWNKLTLGLGAGAGKKMKSSGGWNDNGNGTNQSNFSALPGGFRQPAPDSFGDIGSNGYWWTSSINRVYGFDFGAGLYLKNNSDEPQRDSYGSEGLSVRCVKD